MQVSGLETCISCAVFRPLLWRPACIFDFMHVHPSMQVSKVWKKVVKNELCKKSNPSMPSSFSKEHTANPGLSLDTDLLLEHLFLPETHITGDSNLQNDTNPQDEVVLVKEPLIGIEDASKNKEFSKDNSGRCDHTESKQNTESNSTFYPLTMELRPDTATEFLHAAEQKSRGEFNSSRPFCLVGLHTCGDLGSTALRLFAEVPGARAVCMVGCCYHHITETSTEGTYVRRSWSSWLLKN